MRSLLVFLIIIKVEQNLPILQKIQEMEQNIFLVQSDFFPL